MSEIDMSNYMLIPTPEAITKTQEQIVGIQQKFSEEHDNIFGPDDLLNAIVAAKESSGDINKGIVFTSALAFYWGVHLFAERVIPHITIELLKSHLKEYKDERYSLQQNL